MSVILNDLLSSPARLKVITTTCWPALAHDVLIRVGPCAAPLYSTVTWTPCGAPTLRPGVDDAAVDALHALLHLVGHLRLPASRVLEEVLRIFKCIACGARAS